MDKKMENLYKYFCVAAPVFSLFVVGTMIGGLEAVPALIISGLGTGAISPVAYLGLNHIDNKSKRERINSSSYFLHSAQMFRENKEEYRSIHENTIYFYDYIERKLNSGLMPTTLNIDEHSLENINQFICLINTNYYHKINKGNNIRREQLIDQVLGELVRYLTERRQNEFSHKDVKNILKNCSYIDDKLKKEILKEYKNSRFNFNGDIVYAVNKDLKRYDGIGKSFLGEKKKEFDIDNSSDYSLIIEYITFSDEYKKDKRLVNLDWDIDLIKNMIQMIDCDFGNELRRVRGTYSTLDLVTSFVSNTLNYVVKKEKEKVGKEEIIESFREWGYIPLNMRKSLELDLLYEFDRLDKSKNKEKSIGIRPLK